MAQTRRPQHPNAALTPTQRLKMVRLVEDGWSVAAAAQRFQVDDKTTRKWLDRYRCEGEAGMGDRCCRPRHSPRRTPEPQRQRVIELRRRTRRGAGFIAHVCAMHASTVHRICVQAGLGRQSRTTQLTLRERPGSTQRHTAHSGRSLRARIRYSVAHGEMRAASPVEPFPGLPGPARRTTKDGPLCRPVVALFAGPATPFPGIRVVSREDRAPTGRIDSRTGCRTRLPLRSLPTRPWAPLPSARSRSLEAPGCDQAATPS